MRFSLLIFLTLVVIKGSAQDFDSPYKVYDFSNVDPTKISSEAIAQQIDSIYRTSGYDSLIQLMSHIQKSKYTERYVSFNIGYQSSHASLQDLKTGLSALGFSDLSENFSGVPWGLDIRGKRLLVSYLLVPGIKNRASNDDYSIEVSGINMQLAFGYDVLHLRRLHFYPQFSFALQDFDINITRKNATSDITDVNDLVLNPAGTRLEKSSFDMSYGAELDYHLLHTLSRGGIILGLRYGRVVTLADEKFMINKSKSGFQSSDTIVESFFSIVAKFYIKN
jgi:hypothetical protein